MGAKIEARSSKFEIHENLSPRKGVDRPDEGQTRSQVRVLLRRSHRRSEGEALCGGRDPAGELRGGTARTEGGWGAGAAPSAPGGGYGRPCWEAPPLVLGRS